jgi:peptide/nickel transport system permease protein
VIARLVRSARSNRRLLVGLVLLAAVALAALAGALVASDPFRTSETVLRGPSVHHPFGTDNLGRDVLDRVLHGVGTSLKVSLLAVVAGTVVATVLGLVSGYAGGAIDDLLLKLAELLQVIPGFLLALVAAAAFGASLLLLVIILAVIFFPRTFRLARGEAIGLREREFIHAARAAGARPVRILTRHILPGALTIVLVNASFQAGTAVLIETGLSFLGVSERDTVSLGAMLFDAQSYLEQAWWMSLFPGALVAVTIVSVNLVGDGLQGLRDVRAAGAVGPERPASGSGHGATTLERLAVASSLGDSTKTPKGEA